jgi:4-amino-4-deoxy-L-arabinose transferase-like glycosyltransferase
MKITKFNVKYLNWLFILLIGFSFFLRFLKLGEIPYGLNWDEVNNGYTAYSLLKTGKDEWGAVWPLYTKAFGEYKSIIYATLSTIPIKVFGLNGWSVRFTGAFFSCAIIIAFYFLVKEVVMYYGQTGPKPTLVAKWATLLLAFNPWFFFFSRYAFNPMTSLAFGLFSLLGLFYFLNNKKPMYLFVSVFFSVLSVYGYHSARLIIPLIWLYFGISQWRYFWENKKLSATFIVLLAAAIIPFYFSVKKGQVTKRAYQVAIWQNEGVKEEFNSFFTAASWQQAGMERVFENPKIYYLRRVTDNILANLSFDFLFLPNIDNFRMGPGNSGRFYYFDLLFLTIGFIALTRKRHLALAVGFFILVAILPSALTVEAPHAVRSIWLIFPLIFIAGFGLSNLILKIDKTAVWLAISIFYIAETVFFFRDYFVHFPYVSGSDWQPEYQQVYQFIRPIQQNYQKIFVDSALSQPYMFLFFYQQLDPSYVQNYIVHNQPKEISFSAVDRFDRFYFWPATDNDYLSKGNLILSKKELVSPYLRLLYSAQNKQQQPSFFVYETYETI